MKRTHLVYAVAALAMAFSVSAAARDHRPSVAVVSFTNNGASASWFHGDVGSDLADVLSNELSDTGDFNVVERQKVNAVLAEQDFARSGRVRQGSGPSTGNITGARYLITGSLASYTEDTSSTGGGVSFGGFHIGGGKKQAYVAIDLRVIDSETSEVVYSRTIEGRSTDHSIGLGGSTWRGLGGSFHHSENTPASKAVRAALIEASNYLDCVMVKRDSCIAEYRAKDQRRRRGDEKVLDLDGG